MVGVDVGRTDHYWPWKIHRCVNRVRRRLRRDRHQPWPDVVRPIFVVGAFRSGTTLLSDCLNQHPDVVYCLFEMSPQWRDLAGIELGHGVNRSADCPPLSERDAPADLRERVRDGFAEILAWQGGCEGQRLLNKAPHFSNKLPFLRAVFPDARPVRIEASRNERWREVLSREECEELEAFILAHRERIRRLRYADTNLGTGT